jgi:lysophospholipase L1-like esterase
VQRGLALLAGLLVVLVGLEAGLRIAGTSFTAGRDRDNARNLGEASRVVLCLGESTTALGGRDSYPSQLEALLNERYDGGFRVVNLGKGGRDTRAIIANLDRDLARYEPDAVVAMMGANDDPATGALPEGFGEPPEGRGWLASLRTVRLARLLWFQASRGQGAAPGAPPAPAFGPPAGRDPPPPPGDPMVPVAPGGAPPQGRPPPPPGEGDSFDELALGLDQAAQSLARGQPEEARARFADIIASTLEDDETYLLVCMRIVTTPNPWSGWAVAQTQRILAGRPDARIALQIAGVAYREQGNLTEAEAAFRRALELRALGRWAVQDWNAPMLALLLLLDAQGRTAEADALLARYRQEVGDDERLLSALGGYYSRAGRTARGQALFQEAARLRGEAPNPQSQAAYRRLQAALRARDIPLVAVQYPGRELRGLVQLLDGTDGVVLVDNEADFQEAVARYGFDRVFSDACYGDFGHGSALGNRLLAENVAEALARLWSLTPRGDPAETPRPGAPTAPPAAPG